MSENTYIFLSTNDNIHVGLTIMDLGIDILIINIFFLFTVDYGHYISSFLWP